MAISVGIYPTFSDKPMWEITHPPAASAARTGTRTVQRRNARVRSANPAVPGTPAMSNVGAGIRTVPSGEHTKSY